MGGRSLGSALTGTSSCMSSSSRFVRLLDWIAGDLGFGFDCLSLWTSGVGCRLALGQTFHFKVFCNSKECVELLLSHADLPVVHEVEHALEVRQLDTLEVDERVLVGVATQDVPEEWATGTQNNFVCINLLIITSEGHIKEVFVFSQFPESQTDVGFKVIPSQTKLLTPHCNKSQFSLPYFINQVICSLS